MNSVIGKLKRVALREVWKHEAYDFTQWLQQNLDVLNEALGLTLVNADREHAAGAFSIDLVAEDEGGGTVVIENQLEKSNHDHLGKLITYLTAMSARAAVWIVSEPRPEHVAAMTWLNESTKTAFYLVKVEAVKIGDSPAAPLLTVIVEPSDEVGIREQKQELAERHNIRHRWWSELVKRPAAKLHSHITPGTYSWIGTSSGVRGLNLNYVVSQTDCSAELYIDRGKDAEQENVAIFEQLLAKRESIAPLVTLPISWERLEGRRACRIRVTVEGGYRSPDSEWPAIQDRIVSGMNQLNASLQPHLRQLKLGS